MAGSLRFANVRPPFIATPSIRSATPLIQLSRSPFPHTKFVAAPFTWQLAPHSRIGRIMITASADPGQGIGDGANRLPVSNWKAPFAKFVADNFLPIALVSGVLLGFANPSLGCLADSYYLSKFSTFGIFIISGLMLRSDEIAAAAEAWPVGLFGLTSILLLTPFFSKIIMLLKLQPQEFVTGLAVFCCMPTTLSSGVALTRLAGGNSALALAMTVISSLLGILIIPFTVSKFVGSGIGVSVPAEQLLRSLVITLLLPLILGKIAREVFKGVADFTDGNRKPLGMISAVLLSLVPWIQVSRSRSLLLIVKPEIFLVAVLMGALLHVALFTFNALLIAGLSLVSGGSKSLFAKQENARALLLIASQKTLPVLVAVVDQLHGALGEPGFLVLPCVAAHLNQIIIDSFIVSRWKQDDVRYENAKVA